MAYTQRGRFLWNRRQLKLVVETQTKNQPKRVRRALKLFLRRKRLQHALLEQMEDSPYWQDKLKDFGSDRPLIDFFIENWEEILALILKIISMFV